MPDLCRCVFSLFLSGENLWSQVAGWQVPPPGRASIATPSTNLRILYCHSSASPCALREPIQGDSGKFHYTPSATTTHA